MDESERANMVDPRRVWWEEAQDGAELRKVPKGFPEIGLPDGMVRQFPVGLAAPDRSDVSFQKGLGNYG